MDYIVGDVMEADLSRWGGFFDIVFMGASIIFTICLLLWGGWRLCCSPAGG